MKKRIWALLTAVLLVVSVPVFAGNTIELEVEKRNMYPSVMTPDVSTDKFGSLVKSTLFPNDDGTYSIVENSPLLGTTVSTYTANHKLLNTKNIQIELSEFCGFYKGENHYYIASFDINKKHDDNKEVLRIVQYDKEFNKIKHASVANCYTESPLRGGSLRMAEKDGLLVIHTCRERYSGHQSQLTVMVDTKTMTVTNPQTLAPFPANHVSHSLDQFITIDGNHFVFVDLGDASPRSLFLQRYHPSTGFDTNFSGLIEIPGASGANCTGITVGGLESSDSSYLVPINKVDWTKVQEFTSLEMIGLDKDERDIVLLVQNKNLSTKAKQITLANYVNQNKLGSKPFIVKLANNQFVVLWQEFEYVGDYVQKNNGVKYVYVDGEGNLLSSVLSEPNLKLSSDCQPIIMNNQIVWFINDFNAYNMEMKTPTFLNDTCLRLLQCIPLKTEFASTQEKPDSHTITVKINGKTINFDQPPITINDRTMVPLRGIFEELGATVDWDNDTETVTSSKGDTTIRLTINHDTMFVNEVPVTLDSPACLVNDRTLVPVRAISEAFHCKVDWDEETKTVFITD